MNVTRNVLKKSFKEYDLKGDCSEKVQILLWNLQRKMAGRFGDTFVCLLQFSLLLLLFITRYSSVFPL